MDPANPNPNPNPSPAPASADRPAYIPEKFWDPTTKAVKADDFAAHLNDLSAFKAEQDVRAQGIPASPDKYELKLPESFKAPEGMVFEFNADDPLLAEARKVAHGLRLDNDGFSQLLGVYAANKLAEHQRSQQAMGHVKQELGSAADTRIEQAATWIEAKGGAKGKQTADLLRQFPRTDLVETFETLMRAFSAQGGTAFNQSHRDQDNKPSDEEFGKWSYSEQREFHNTGKRPGRAAA